MKIDNFALTMFQSCPAKFDLRINERWTTRRKSSALGFGGALHEGLAEWYRSGDGVKAVTAISEAWPLNVPIDDYRTKEKCVRTMLEYMKEYPHETFSVVGAPSNPMVECVFTLPTGLYLNCQACPGVDQEITDPFCNRCGQLREQIEYGGIFDGLVQFGDTIYVLEHKTTSQMGQYYFNQFKPNNQVTGYVWGGNRLMGSEDYSKVGGAIINGIGVYKSSATKFEREITTRSKEEINEWLINLRSTCQMIADCRERGYWPMHTPSCTMYGRCEFHDVHVLNPVERPKRLELDYIREEWSHEDRAGTKDEGAA